MVLRKVTFRLYPNAAQAERLTELLGLHQRVYNTALEECIRAYQVEGTSLNFASQCKALSQWQAHVPHPRFLDAAQRQRLKTQE